MTNLNMVKQNCNVMSEPTQLQNKNCNSMFKSTKFQNVNCNAVKYLDIAKYKKL